MHPWGAVGRPAPVVDLVDPLGESSVFPAPARRRPVFPVVVAAARDAQYAAHERDRKAAALSASMSLKALTLSTILPGEEGGGFFQEVPLLL